MGKQLVWNVTVVHALAPSRLNQGSLCNPGTTATEAKVRKIEKYHELNRQWIHFSTGGLGCSGFFKREQRSFHHASLQTALSFARWSTSWQLFEATDFNGSLDQQCGQCSRNCERQRFVQGKLLHITYFFKPLYHCCLKKISTGRLG